MEREVGGGIGMGNTCKPLAVSFLCMTKSTTNKKIKIKKKKERLRCGGKEEGARREQQTGRKPGPHWLLTKYRGQGYRGSRNNLKVSSVNTAARHLYEKDQEEGLMGVCSKLIKQQREDFSGGTVGKNLPANAGDASLNPGPGRCRVF